MTDTPDKEWIERARNYLSFRVGSYRAEDILDLAHELQSADAQGVERERARCEAVADEYRARMAEAAKIPHPYTGKENTIALCKEDAATSILADIRDPRPALTPTPTEEER